MVPGDVAFLLFRDVVRRVGAGLHVDQHTGVNRVIDEELLSHESVHLLCIVCWGHNGHELDRLTRIHRMVDQIVQVLE